mmetsp:Transcript_16567/g.47184  ORF Transcript_16567/g.47184 Transcript_16567/m.47184 type:complete len:201 (+) Transcript_16567:856-1458(+)
MAYLFVTDLSNHLACRPGLFVQGNHQPASQPASSPMRLACLPACLVGWSCVCVCVCVLCVCVLCVRVLCVRARVRVCVCVCVLGGCNIATCKQQENRQAGRQSVDRCQSMVCQASARPMCSYFLSTDSFLSILPTLMCSAAMRSSHLMDRMIFAGLGPSVLSVFLCWCHWVHRRRRPPPDRQPCQAVGRGGAAGVQVRVT